MLLRAPWSMIFPSSIGAGELLKCLRQMMWEKKKEKKTSLVFWERHLFILCEIFYFFCFDLFFVALLLNFGGNFRVLPPFFRAVGSTAAGASPNLLACRASTKHNQVSSLFSSIYWNAEASLQNLIWDTHTRASCFRFNLATARSLPPTGSCLCQVLDEHPLSVSAVSYLVA